MKENKLKNHFKYLLSQIKSSYDNTKGIVDHKGLNGGLREVFIANFLQKTLPKQLECVTNVELLDSNKNSSGEVDICIYSELSPRLILENTTGVVFNDHVLFCFEVKSELTKQYLVQALKKIIKIKSLNRDINIVVERNNGSSHLELEQTSTCCGLVFYGGLSCEKVKELIDEYFKENNIEADKYYPDIILNIGDSEILIRNNNWLISKQDDCAYLLIKGEEVLIYLFFYIYLVHEAHHIGRIEGALNLKGYLLDS